MKKIVLISAAAALAHITAGSALALNYGNNITIYDGTGVSYEDQETEPGMVNSQVWDLEGFFLNGTILSMVGGYDFKEGEWGNGHHFTSGDIFIDTEGGFGSGFGPSFSTDGNKLVNSSYGYEFAISLDFSSGSYSVQDLQDPAVQTQTVFYHQNMDTNPSSNPWRLASGGQMIADGSFVFLSGLAIDTDFNGDGLSDFTGGSHYAMTGIDLSFLAGQEFTAHFTMGCGNDNLMGQGTVPVPEPATMLLFGTGLAGLAGRVRRRKK